MKIKWSLLNKVGIQPCYSPQNPQYYLDQAAQTQGVQQWDEQLFSNSLIQLFLGTVGWFFFHLERQVRISSALWEALSSAGNPGKAD